MYGYKYRCPHCNKCVAINRGTDPDVYVSISIGPPEERPDAHRSVIERKCSECKRLYHVEVYFK